MSLHHQDIRIPVVSHTNRAEIYSNKTDGFLIALYLHFSTKSQAIRPVLAPNRIWLTPSHPTSATIRLEKVYLASRMSGLDVLGAIASSLQLVETCSDIVRLVIAIPSGHNLLHRVESDCKALLQCISDSLHSQSEETIPAASKLAAQLQQIRSAIEAKKRTWLLAGNGTKYRDLMVEAIQAYLCELILWGTAAKQKLSKDMLLVIQKLETLENRNKEIQVTLQNIKAEASHHQRTILKELGNSHTFTPISSILVSQSPSRGLTPDYGTMGEYLREIWRTGGGTTDQDIWECYYDIISVYIDNSLPITLRFSPGDHAALCGTYAFQTSWLM